jgi:aminoglycoside phosphotransferase (APT) family kinase protein
MRLELPHHLRARSRWLRRPTPRKWVLRRSRNVGAKHGNVRVDGRVATQESAPMKKDAITAAVAADLVAEQFPQWADLPVVPVALNGWDNTTFRLGDSLSVRLPSHDRYVPQVEKEQRWLPALAPLLPLPIPEPVALGRPSDIFPRPWSIYRWIEGHPAVPGEVSDFGTFANDLARFLSALYSVDAGQGPEPGDHCFFRGGPLDPYDAQSRDSIAVVAGEIDPGLATGAWEAALASSWDRPAVWVHGDVAPSNLLAMSGRLAAVIDFGCAAVGDPACDLVMAWTFFSGESRAAFRRSLALDEATWARARGWALWKALIHVAQEKRGGQDSTAVVQRAGWRFGAREVIAAVLTDYCASN